MNSLRKLIFKSRILAPIKYCVNALSQKEAATQQAIKAVGEENITKKLLRGMIWNYSKYHFSFDEYFTYQLAFASQKKKDSFIPYYDQIYWIMAINRESNEHIFNNKQETYETFGKFFRRDLICLPSDSGDDKRIFSDFVKNHSQFIIKPNNSSRGRGISIVDVNGSDTIADETFNSIITEKKHGVILEELIHQSDSMGHFHPCSVNTVRTITVCLDDRVEMLPPSCRIGMGGSIVDNGCISCAVDMKTGVIKRAINKQSGKEYVVHPDTGVPIVGAKIPDWEACIRLSEELAMVVPSNRYTGWDLAHTDNGWVLVEANSISDMMCQYSHGVGCKEQMTKWCKEIGVKPFS